MSWSFRTNGNFIDFVHTDETSLAVENTIVSLHNTSKCVSWSLPEDTTRISFTIDEVKYSNILITDIDFDGTAMNSQDDFETGIEAMFTGLAGGGGGGVESVTGDAVDNTDPANPVINTTGWGTNGVVAELTGSANLQLDGSDFSIMDGVSHFIELNPAAGLYFFGDVDTMLNGSFLTIDDTNKKAIIQIEGNDCLIINADDGIYRMGDNSARLDIEALDKTIALGFSGVVNLRIDNNVAGFINLDTPELKINGSAGATGSFEDANGNTITVTKGIITAITPP